MRTAKDGARAAWGWESSCLKPAAKEAGLYTGLPVQCCTPLKWEVSHVLLVRVLGGMVRCHLQCVYGEDIRSLQSTFISAQFRTSFSLEM